MQYTAERHALGEAHRKVADLASEATIELVNLPAGSPDLDRVQGRVIGLREAAQVLYQMSRC